MEIVYLFEYFSLRLVNSYANRDESGGGPPGTPKGPPRRPAAAARACLPAKFYNLLTGRREIVENCTMERISFQTDPSRYRHWRLSVEGAIATLAMDVDEAGGLVEGYELKLNSYDLGVDIELYDAVQRLRCEHSEVKTVVLTSAKDKIFCAGANIRMLAASPHPWKVNFSKYTNETRNGIQDASAISGQTWLAALNGTASGGGYELALACEHIMLIDDRSAVVSLPELPLLGVLPGTGGLTRVTDKR